MAEDTWEADRFEDGSTKLVGDLQVEKMESFSQSYAQELLALEDVLDTLMASSGGDQQWDAVTLDAAAYESASVVDLVHTPSKPVTKITLALASLCEEMASLKALAEPRFLAPLALYAELSSQQEGEQLEGEAQVQLARLLPLLVSLSQYVARCLKVATVTLQQLACVHHPKQSAHLEGVHFTSVWKYLAQLLETLATLDALLAQSPALVEAWGKLKRMVAQIKKAPSTYGVQDEQRLFVLDKLLLQLQGSLLDANVFASALRLAVDDPARGVVVRSNAAFKAAFSATLKALVQDLVQAQQTQHEPWAHGRKFLAVSCLLCLEHALFEDVAADKKLLAQLWEQGKQNALVPLYANAAWTPHAFFATHVPRLVREAGLDKKMAEAQGRAGQQLAALQTTLAERVRTLEMRVGRWLAHAESDPQTLKIRSPVLLKGAQLAQTLSELVQRYLLLHHHFAQPLKAAHLPLLLRALVLVKAVHAMYQRRAALIAEAVALLSHRVASALQRLLWPAVEALSDVRKRATDATLDARAAATLALQSLHAPPTRARMIVFRLAFHQLPRAVLNAAGEGVADEVAARLQQWSELAQLGATLKRATDCSWLTWTPQLIAPWLGLVYKDTRHARALPWLFTALRDAEPLLRRAIHVEPHVLLTEWRVRVFGHVHKEIVEPLCAEIHRDLTEQVHHSRPLVAATLGLPVASTSSSSSGGGSVSAVASPARKLVGGAFGQRDVSRLLAVGALRVYDGSVRVDASVAHSLARVFYNLNTVALYDWATFGVMRSLAHDKYGLELQDAHLPGQTLEQGLDVLEIMRHIASFVAAYRYNLHNQLFLEAQSEHKTLQAIGVAHIANSIRTHGPGIMSTAVSVTFQFLKEKVHLFSQFLFDEMIKSRLYRDLRQFQELKKERSTNLYPYDKARKFQQYVRQLGAGKDKQSYLDKFRRLITEMGNAMGYVRMIRSGGLLYTSNAIQFVPDLNAILKFEELTQQAALSAESVAAAHNLDGVVDTLSANFAAGTDYFKMLVNVFKAQYDAAQPENAHLANFHLSVPALTLSFVEHMSQDKERYNKRRAEEGVFTDDGFALGIAYLLKLTGTEKDFDALNWFQSARAYYVEEMQSTAKDRENVKISALTRTKLQAELKELELLRATFSAARIFFHD